MANKFRIEALLDNAKQVKTIPTDQSAMVLVHGNDQSGMVDRMSSQEMQMTALCNLSAFSQYLNKLSLMQMQWNTALAGRIRTLNRTEISMAMANTPAIASSTASCSIPMDRTSIPTGRSSIPIDRSSIPMGGSSIPTGGSSIPTDIRRSLSNQHQHQQQQHQHQHQHHHHRRGVNVNGGEQRSSTTKKYRCDICEKTFSRSNTLITHKRIHTGEKPFQCEHCGRAFRQPGNLTRHRLTHTTVPLQVKPYVCAHCEKAFNRASNLHTHMRTHNLTSNRSTRQPYPCSVCGKSFSHRLDLKMHSYSHVSYDGRR